jgi:uncharacterized protein YjbI with pentapeptide repeats
MSGVSASNDRVYVNRGAASVIAGSTDTNEKLFQNRIRKLERITSDLVEATVDVQKQVGTAVGPPGKPTAVIAKHWLGNTTIRWTPAENCASYEVVASSFADVTTGTTVGAATGNSIVHNVPSGAKYYWVRGANAEGTTGAWSDMVLATVGASDQQSVINEIVRTSALISSLRNGIEAANARLAAIEGYLDEQGIDPSGIIQRIEEGELPNALMETILFARKTRANARTERATIRQYVETKVNELGEATATELTQLEAKADSTIASLATERTTRASADSANASAIAQLSGTVADNHASIVDVLGLEVTPDGAVAERLEQIETDVGGNAAAVQENSQAIAALDETVSASHTIKVQAQTVGGKKVVAGIGLMANSSGDTEFTVAANKFVVVDPTDADGSSIKMPFIIYNGTVYMDMACIRDGTITNAMIGDAQITSAKIGAAQIKTANIDSAAITEAKIANGAITKAKIGDAAIGTAQIEDGAIANAKIGAAAIKSANIENGAITSAKIGDAAIETAHIKDLSVDTIKIKDGACSANAGAVRSGTATVYNFPTLICSCSVTTVAEQSVFLHGTGESCAGTRTDVWHKPTYVALYRQSTQLVKLVGSGWYIGQLPFNDMLAFAISWIDSPGAGTFTYALRAWCEYDSNYPPNYIPKVGNCALSVFQFKK